MGRESVSLKVLIVLKVCLLCIEGHLTLSTKGEYERVYMRGLAGAMRCSRFCLSKAVHFPRENGGRRPVAGVL